MTCASAWLHGWLGGAAFGLELLAVLDGSRRKALTDWNCVIEGRVGPLVFEGWNVPDIREIFPSGDDSVLVAPTKHCRPIPSYPVF